MKDYTDEELDNISVLLCKNIVSLPVNGVFKIRIGKIVSKEDKAKTEAMVQHLASKLGRPDIVVIVEGREDLN
jgi:hypothetical protein